MKEQGRTGKGIQPCRYLLGWWVSPVLEDPEWQIERARKEMDRTGQLGKNFLDLLSVHQGLSGQQVFFCYLWNDLHYSASDWLTLIYIHIHVPYSCPNPNQSAVFTPKRNQLNQQRQQVLANQTPSTQSFL